MMAEFEPGFSGAQSDHCAITTAQIIDRFISFSSSKLSLARFTSSNLDVLSRLD